MTAARRVLAESAVQGCGSVGDVMPATMLLTVGRIVVTGLRTGASTEVVGGAGRGGDAAPVVGAGDAVGGAAGGGGGRVGMVTGKVPRGTETVPTGVETPTEGAPTADPDRPVGRPPTDTPADAGTGPVAATPTEAEPVAGATATCVAIPGSRPGNGLSRWSRPSTNGRS
jgi:hypothetical protein